MAEADKPEEPKSKKRYLILILGVIFLIIFSILAHEYLGVWLIASKEKGIASGFSEWCLKNLPLFVVGKSILRAGYKPTEQYIVEERSDFSGFVLKYIYDDHQQIRMSALSALAWAGVYPKNRALVFSHLIGKVRAGESEEEKEAAARVLRDLADVMIGGVGVKEGKDPQEEFLAYVSIIQLIDLFDQSNSFICGEILTILSYFEGKDEISLLLAQKLNDDISEKNLETMFMIIGEMSRKGDELLPYLKPFLYKKRTVYVNAYSALLGVYEDPETRGLTEKGTLVHCKVLAEMLRHKDSEIRKRGLEELKALEGPGKDEILKDMLFAEKDESVISALNSVLEEK